MINSQCRLLLSAHDPGAGRAMVNLVRAAQEDERFVTNVVAHGPAFEILRSSGLAVEWLECPRIATADSRKTSRLKDVAREVIARYGPDAIATGLSGPDAGLDEALADFAPETVQTFAVQDFWGDVNQVLDRKADTFLVCDRFAASATRERLPEAEVTIIGSLRHSDLRAVPRKRARQDLGIDADDVMYVLFGQPLWHIAGYERTLSALAHAIGNLGAQPCIWYRPHPRETASQRERTEAIFQRAGVRVFLGGEPRIETLLVSCDLALSPYSTVSNDLAYLQRISKEQLGISMFLLWDEDLKRYYTQYTGLRHHPLADLGVALVVDSQEQLASRLAQAICPEMRDAVCRAAHELPDPTRAPQAALDAIYMHTLEATG